MLKKGIKRMLREAILEALRGGPLNPRELAYKLGATRGEVTIYLIQLKRMGLVEKIDKELWRRIDV